MKAQLIKVLKSPVLYIIIGIIIALLVSFLIAYGPKKLSRMIKTEEIDYISIDNGAYVIDNADDIQKFTKLIKRSTYIKTYYERTWVTLTPVVIHYLDGSTISFGPHRITINGDKIIMMWSTNFDYKTMYKIVGIEKNMWP